MALCKKNEGAYPHLIKDMYGEKIVQGLSKREYFASFALMGFCGKGYKPKEAAEMAVLASEELIRQLNSTAVDE